MGQLFGSLPGERGGRGVLDHGVEEQLERHVRFAVELFALEGFPHLANHGAHFGSAALLSGLPLRGQEVETFEPVMEAPVEALPEIDMPDPSPEESVPEEMPEPFALSLESWASTRLRAVLADLLFSKRALDEILTILPDDDSIPNRQQLSQRAAALVRQLDRDLGNLESDLGPPPE